MKDLLDSRLRDISESSCVAKEKVWDICEAGHSTKACPTIFAYKAMNTEQVDAIGGFKENFNVSHGNSYNPSWRNHPGFNYGQPQAAMNPHSQVVPPPPPPQYHQAPTPPVPYVAPQRMSLEDTMNQFINSQGANNARYECLFA